MPAKDIESYILGATQPALATHFQAWRRDLDKTQEQMAALLGLSRGYIRNLEQGTQELGSRGERAICRYLARQDAPSVEERLAQLEARVRVLEQQTQEAAMKRTEQQPLIKIVREGSAHGYLEPLYHLELQDLDRSCLDSWIDETGSGAGPSAPLSYRDAIQHAESVKERARLLGYGEVPIVKA